MIRIKNRFSLATAAIFFLAVTSSIEAGEAGTKAADFLNIGISARVASLGGANRALANGVASSYYNPAGLSAVDQIGVNFAHIAWYQDISYEYLGAAIPISSSSTIGLSASYLNFGQIDAYDSDNQRQGYQSPYSLSGIVAYSRRFSDNLSVALGAKYIMERLADVEANGYALDFGSEYAYDDMFLVGLAINNIGPKLKYEIESFSLPASLSFGAALKPFRFPMTLMVGAKFPFGESANIGVGTEYKVSDLLSLRTGLDGLGVDDRSKSINVGAGLNVMGGCIDYAFNPGDALGQTHFFSLTVSFGENSRAESRKEISSSR